MNRKRNGSDSGHGQSVVKCPSPEIDINASSCSTTSCPRASRRSKKSAESVDDEIDVNRCVFALELLLMMLALAQNGCSASVQGGFMRNALTMMMSAQISVSYAPIC